MTVFINNNPITLPADNMNVADLAEWKNIPSGGSAIALNDKLIPHNKWSETYLNEGDKLLVVAVAFGG